ncbi:MAG: RIP metalloprotease RseP [Candidatus Moraniibacteriota bacterium]
MLTILIFILLLGLLVFVHEMGHFLVARYNGIKADEFGFGFPPRLIGIVKDDQTGRYRVVFGNRDVRSTHTVYSINWIPLGGFVKIKGEDAAAPGGQDSDSFAKKPARIRILVLAAGVLMNFLLAWVLISIVFMLGIPEPIDEQDLAQHPDARIQILEIVPQSVAQEIGLKPGDILERLDGQDVRSLDQVSGFVAAHRGQEIRIELNRFGEEMTITGTPKTEVRPGEGALGISYAFTAKVKHPWYQAIADGARATANVTLAIFAALGKMIGGLFGIAEKTPVEITGPVGIVYLTKQMSDLGFAYLLQFAALLSINLGIINILPIPALDGGRILFVLIEKLKGKPVSERLEGTIHQIGFALLLLLMLIVTLRDFRPSRSSRALADFFPKLRSLFLPIVRKSL